MAQDGLRARKKQQTRQAISDVATRLFLERGFDDVTIADVAAAASVAKMTVTNHFPRKEDLILDVHRELVAAPVRALAERPAGESACAAIRRWYGDALDRSDPLLGFAGRPFARLVTGSPTLSARLRDLHDEREQQLAGRLVVEGVDAVEAAAVAAILGGVCRVLMADVLRRIAAGQRPRTVRTAAARAAERAFALLDGGLPG